MLTRRDSIAFIFLSFFGTVSFQFLCGFQSFQNTANFLFDRKKFVAVVDAERLIPVGIVWQLAELTFTRGDTFLTYRSQ